MMLRDKKTGEEVSLGSSIKRRAYPGRMFRYEVLARLDDGRLWVGKLDGDEWVYLRMTPASLRLEVVKDVGAS
jgi:hypothetical protein